MKYSVSINEKKRTITVTLADGSKGVARCCPTDNFNIQTGVELALERAKNSKAAKPAKPVSIIELVKALEAALPQGQMVIVGHGGKMTDAQKEWLCSLAGGCSCSCSCHDEPEEEGEYYTEDDIAALKKEAYDEGYDEGKSDGYDDGYGDGYDKGCDETRSECCDIEEQRDEYHAALKNILNALEEVGIV